MNQPSKYLPTYLLSLLILLALFSNCDSNEPQPGTTLLDSLAGDYHIHSVTKPSCHPEEDWSNFRMNIEKTSDTTGVWYCYGQPEWNTALIVWPDDVSFRVNQDRIIRDDGSGVRVSFHRTESLVAFTTDAGTECPPSEEEFVFPLDARWVFLMEREN